MPDNEQYSDVEQIETGGPRSIVRNNHALPNGWSETRLADVVYLARETIDPSEVPNALYIGLENIESNTRRLLGTSKARGVKSTKNVFKAGDVLYGKLRPYLNKVSLPDFDGICSTEILVMRCESNVEPKFIALVLNSSAFAAFAMSKSTGLNLPRVTFAKISSFSFALPPLLEQKRIVDRVHVLEKRLHDAQRSLGKIPALLSQIRQSLLVSAMGGKFTDKSGENMQKFSADKTHTGKEQLEFGEVGNVPTRHVIPGVAALSVGDTGTSLPKGWFRTALIEIAKLESGHTPSRRHPEYWNGDVNWISIPDARDHNGETINITQSTITQNGLANSAARILPKGTVCLSRTASIGYVVIMGKPMATSQDFANWICSPTVLPEFLMYAFLAEGDNLVRFGKGTTHTTIYYSELQALYIALPPVSEQSKVIRKLQVALARLEIVSQTYSKISDEIDTLRQNIIISALRGELVPQDSNDKPASQLLDEILATRRTKPTAQRKIQKGRAMKNLTQTFVVDAINNFPKDQFSFDELRSVVPGSYEEIKVVLFALLAQEGASLKQVFDPNLRMMVFEKVKL